MAAFDRIFLRHNDRLAITETDIIRLKREMVGKCVRFKLQTGLLQRTEKTLGITNTRHGMYCLRAKIMQRAVRSGADVFAIVFQSSRGRLVNANCRAAKCRFAAAAFADESKRFALF